MKRAASVSISAFLIVVLLVVVTTKEAHAYIDLGTGSLMLQMLVALGVSSLLAIKIFWYRFTGTVSRVFSKIKGSTPEAK